MKSNDSTVLAVSFLPTNVAETVAKVYLQNFGGLILEFPRSRLLDFSICSAEKNERERRKSARRAREFFRDTRI